MEKTPLNYTGDILTLDGIFNNEISLFKGYTGTKVIDNITIKKFLNNVKIGIYKDQIVKLRTSNNADEKKFIKSNINAVTLSYKCKSRNKDDKNKLINHSGIIQIDIDKLEVDKLAAINNVIQNDKYTLFSFISPSGNGIKIGIQIDGNYHAYTFKKLIDYYKKNYDIDIDFQTGDILRLLTYSFDSELFINPNAINFEIDLNEYNKELEHQNNAITSEIQRDYFNNDKILDKSYLNALNTCKEMLNKSVDGNKSNSRLKVGIILGGYVGGGLVSEIDAINDITTTVKQNTTLSIKDALKDVYSGLEYGKKRPFINLPFCFWYEIVINKTPQLKIDILNLYNFLIKNGFGLIKIDGKESPLLCRINNKTISETNTDNLRNFILNELDKLPNEISNNFTKIDLHKLLINGSSGFFHKDKYSIAFKIIHYKPFKDSETVSYHFFNNCYVEVTRDCIFKKDYKDFDGLIWDSQIINFDFKYLSNYDDYRNFDFVKFIENLCKSRNTGFIDVKRLDALHSIIGYLLHNYRSPSNTKAVVLTEADSTGYAQGGTGKGLLLQSINKLKKVTIIDGKNFNFANQFAFQNVTLDTQIILLDDVNKDFHFERLYSQITEGISFEKKGRDRIKLEYEYSPKFVITTNFGLKGVSESDKRRQYEMEIMTYYNAEYRPIKDFKREFFNDWIADDYNKFYNFMLWCVKNYLNKVNRDNGYDLPDYKSETLFEVKLKANTSVEFVEFITDLEYNVTYNYADVYNNYINETGDKISKTTFTNYLKLYAEHKKLRPPTARKRVKSELQTIIFLTPIEENMYNNVK